MEVSINELREKFTPDFNRYYEAILKCGHSKLISEIEMMMWGGHPLRYEVDCQICDLEQIGKLYMLDYLEVFHIACFGKE